MTELKRLRRSTVLAAWWILVTLLCLAGSTYAWIHYSATTNVTPTAGTISEGTELLISNDPEGVFAAECTLNARGEVLEPVSTADRQRWYSALMHDADGISVVFEDVSESIDSKSVYGSVWLQSKGAATDVYFLNDGLSIQTTPQTLAALRLVLTVTDANGADSHVFRCDALGDTTGAESRLTVPEDNTVIASLNDRGGAIYTADPAESLEAYTAGGSTEHPTAGTNKLCTVAEDATVRVDFRLYLEGCDPECLNAIQANDVVIRLGFAGVAAEGS